MSHSAVRWITVYLSLGLLLAGLEARAQQRFNTRVVVAVVPVVGAGTLTDPRRPMFTPAPSERGASEALDYQCTFTDDGKSAIVAFFVSRPSEASWKKLDEIISSKESGVTAFDKDKHGPSEIETELKKHKKDFDLTEFLGSVEKKGGVK